LEFESKARGAICGAQALHQVITFGCVNETTNLITKGIKEITGSRGMKSMKGKLLLLHLFYA